jgi:hypothetical protein
VDITTDIENLVVSKNKPVSSFQSSLQRDPKYMKHSQIFGEMAIVMKHKDKKM